MAIDATVGGTTADSYSDVATADAYHDARLHNDEWAAATEATKEKALKWATRLLDDYLWVGEPAATTQALEWPRSYVYDRYGNLLADDEIPVFLLNATAELAWSLLKEDTTIPDDNSRYESLTLDGVGSLTMSKQGEKTAVSGAVTRMISDYTTGGGTGTVMVTRV